MAHGFGKGLVEVAGQVLGKGSGTIKRGYDSSYSYMGKAGNDLFSGMRKSQDMIANPHMYEKSMIMDDFGNSVPGKRMESTIDNYGKNIDINQKPNSWARQKGNLAKHHAKDITKGFGIGAAISGSMYGLSAYMSDNSDNDASDRMLNVAKHGIAATVDIGADLGLSAVAAGLATFGGPMGMIAGGTLQAFNMFAGFAGMDVGSIAMNAMNSAEESYETAKKGPKFNMTQNSSMALQRQIQNMHGSGSNLGEMMHNAVDKREIYDCLQNNQFDKPENLCGTNYKKSRTKMAPTFQI